MNMLLVHDSEKQHPKKVDGIQSSIHLRAFDVDKSGHLSTEESREDGKRRVLYGAFPLQK